MTKLKKFLASAAIAATALGLAAGPASATALTVGTGWTFDQVDEANTASENSPFTFSGVSGESYQFSVVDGFNPGDTYTITLNGSEIFTSTFGLTFTPFDNNTGPDASSFAEPWTDTDFSRFALDFGPGDFSFVVAGDCKAGCPSGFGYRLDLIPSSVPEPLTLSLFGAGLAGIVVVSRRRKARKA